MITWYDLRFKKVTGTVDPKTNGRGMIAELLKNIFPISSSNKGNNNSIKYDNIGVGNTVNVTVPSSGMQKIIYPNGKVELHSLSPSAYHILEVDSEKQLLQAEVAHLKDTMQAKDDLIIYLKETIELLKHEHC